MNDTSNRAVENNSLVGKMVILSDFNGREIKRGILERELHTHPDGYYPSCIIDGCHIILDASVVGPTLTQIKEPAFKNRLIIQLEKLNRQRNQADAAQIYPIWRDMDRIAAVLKNRYNYDSSNPFNYLEL